jgi:DNA modification methylase
MEPLVVRLSDSVTIINADCRDVLPVECDAVVTDPPYGIGHVAKANETKCRVGLRNQGRIGDAYGRHSGQIIGDNAPFDPTPWLRWPCVLWGAGYYHERLPSGGGWLLWDKKPQGGFEKWDAGDGDMAWTSREGAPRIFRMVWMGLVRGEVEKSDGGQNAPSAHPNQKPVALMSWCMEQARVPEGATVLDPYMGSGTTGIACIRTGRKFIGVEKDARYFEIARKRLENELRQGRLPLTYTATPRK